MLEKETQTEPWWKLCVDLIIPNTILWKGNHKPYLTLRAVTMMNPATGWFEIATYDDKNYWPLPILWNLHDYRVIHHQQILLLIESKNLLVMNAIGNHSIKIMYPR